MNTKDILTVAAVAYLSQPAPERAVVERSVPVHVGPCDTVGCLVCQAGRMILKAGCVLAGLVAVVYFIF